MMGYDIVVIANFDIGGRVGQLSCQCMGNTVVVDILVKTCVTILVDRCNNMLFHLVTDRVQRSEGFLLYILEVTAARVIAAIQVFVVVLLKHHADSYVERPKIREVKRFDNREDVLIGQLDRVLYMRLILGAMDAGRISCDAVMLSEPLELTNKARTETARRICRVRRKKTKLTQCSEALRNGWLS